MPQRNFLDPALVQAHRRRQTHPPSFHAETIKEWVKFYTFILKGLKDEGERKCYPKATVDLSEYMVDQVNILLNH